MAIAHAASAILFCIRKMHSKRTDYGSCIKTICRIVRVLTYLGALTWVLIAAIDAKNEQKDKYEGCDDLKSWLGLFENYRQLEYAVFFCQIIALSMYLLICKLLTIAKERFASEEEIKRLIRTGDPFWNMLFIRGKSDFMRQENFFM